MKAASIASCLAITLAACVEPEVSAEEEEIETAAVCPRSANPAAAVTITNASFRSDASVTDSEHCRVGPTHVAALEGRQVRVSNNTRTGLCTVVGAHAIDLDGNGVVDANVVAMSSGGMSAKFGSTAATSGSLRTSLDGEGWVTQCLSAPSVSPPYVPAGGLGEFYMRAPGASLTNAVFTAPHGGEIEILTDDQIDYILGSIEGNYAAWSVLGVGTNPHSRWHVTSTELSPASFHGLRQIANGGPNMVVSFHGHNSCTPDVVVGGGVSADFRTGVRRSIEQQLAEAGITNVVVSTDTGCHGGTHDDNFVNDHSDFGDGLQIEQSLTMRQADAGNYIRTRAVARGVSQYVMGYADAPSRSVGTGSALRHGYSGARWSVPANTRVRSDIDYGACSPGDAGRADWYVRVNWELTRIGGGDLTCTSVPWLGYRFRGAAGFQHVDRTRTTSQTIMGVVVGVANSQVRMRLY